MRKLLLAFLFLGLFLVAVIYFKKDSLTLISPIPKPDSLDQSSVDISLNNNWFPKKSETSSKKSQPLSLSSKSAILVDYDTGEILFSKDPNLKLSVASTVKIMTALVTLSSARLTDVYTVSQKAAEVGENSMNLEAGEKLTVEELLYGLMLVSGNDAAITLAEGVSGTDEKFVKQMNIASTSLSLKNTKFINPSGLDEDGQSQYATAYDLSVIARYTWENYPKFREISSTYHKIIDANQNHKAFDLYNDTNLLTSYPGVRGIKPGFTWESGLCLVTYAENGGKRLLGVILGSVNRRGEMKELLDYGFAQYGIKVEHPGLDL